MENECRIEVGPPIPSVPAKQIVVGYYDGGFKGAIFLQLGSSDTWVAVPTTFKNVIKFYWDKINDRC